MTGLRGNVWILGAALAALTAAGAAAQEITAEQAFSFVDSDGNGSLSFEEVNTANPNVDEEVFAEFDGDGDGALSQAEFADLFENGPPPPGM